MYENEYGNKIFITMQDIMSQMDISDKTLHRMIEDGELPDFTYGSRTTRKKGWHASVLERHAMNKYEQSNSFKNACNISQVRGKDVAVMPLSSGHDAMTEKGRNLDNRDTVEKQLGSKVMSKRMGASSKSRVAAGFTNIVA